MTPGEQHWVSTKEVDNMNARQTAKEIVNKVEQSGIFGSFDTACVIAAECTIENDELRNEVIRIIMTEPTYNL